MIGVVGMIVAASIDYHHLERFSVLIMLAVVGMMLLVLLPGLGDSNYGAQRWLSGSARFRPSSPVSSRSWR